MESKAKDYCIRAAIALLLMMFTGISAWAQDPANIGSIQYNSTLGAYEINSVQNLNDLAVYVNGRGTYSTSGDETTVHSCEGLIFKQTANITYTGTNNYTPIGLYVYGGDGFQGTFDGQGNTISGIYCTGDGLTGEEESLGLFGWNQGTVRNVTLSGCRFASANNENDDYDNDAIYVYIGSIAGINNRTGSITGCTVTGCTVSRTRTAYANRFETFIGGIAGDNTGNITDCTYSGSVTGTYSGSNINTGCCTFRIGGIAGISENGGSITGCGSDAAVSCSAPNVSAPSLSVGGIAGANNGMHHDATVSDCFFSGTLSGTGKTGGSTSYIHIGALVGLSINSSIVTNNYYYGDYTSTIGSEGGNGTLANLVRVYQLTGNGITATAPQGSGTTFKGVSYFKADATVTLAPQAGYVLTAASYNDGSENHEITPDNGVWSFQMPANDVTVTATFTPDPAHFSVNAAGTEYTIKTPAGWGVFCDALQDNTTYNRFSGKTVKLDDNITVTRMAGSDYHDFCGTFDGQGHTLTFNYTTTEDCAAPFRNVESGCVIENLHVSGTINTSAMFAAGLVCDQYGAVTIRNCRSSVTINSTVSGDGTHAGLVARNGNGSGSALTIEGCVFDGRLLGPSTNSCGGFIGWRYKTATIRNSLFAPAEVTVQNEGSATFACNTVDTYNCYYTTLLNDGTNYAPAYVGGTETPNLWRNGKATRTVTGGDGVTISAIALTSDATQYSVSGITAYSSGGLQRGENLYYGSGDQLSLTLSNTATGAPAGYQYDGYTASAGTLSGSTLTMPDEDVTVSLALAVLPWSGDGTESSPYIIEYASQLDLLAYRVNGTHGETANYYDYTYFKLNNDISYPHKADGEEGADTESNYEAIGGYYGGDRSFCGHFDGNNKTISGIRIYKVGSSNADNFQGIFGRTASGADIHDLTLADARITGYNFTGGIVGYNDDTVTRCHVAGDVVVCAVQSDAYFHGGIVGNNDGTIEQCTSAATLTTDDAANSKCYGGIAGDNWGTLRDNLAIGATVPAAAANTYGAITGSNDIGSLQRNYYAACKVANTENATGVGCEAADVTADNGAVPGYFITLSEGITIAAGATTFTIPAHGETAEVTYHVAAAGANVTLSYSGTTGDAPNGYQYGFTASAGTLSCSTLTMPAADVTVSFGLTVLPWSGDGSEGNPYIIYNKDQLDLLAHRVNGTHGETANDYNDTYFKLANDISYTHKADGEEGADTESNYEAIGGRYNGNDCYFCGHFDGNNKTISGIRIYKDGTGDPDCFQGIFGYAGQYADIHDLTLADARITGYNFTGGIVGYTDQYADIHDLTLADARITGYDDTGGIVGINDGTVTRCHVAGDVAVCAVQSDAYFHGGIVGYNNGTIEQCTSAATLTTADATYSKYYGGIAGDNWGTLRDNLAIGATVPATKGNSYGAITGRNDDNGSLQHNYYAACKVADTENATGVGCGYISDGNGGYTTADVNNDNNPDGAVCINTLALAANQAPDGNFWTTYYNGALGFTIDADENACAYTAEYDNTNSQLTLHKLGKVIPKGTAVILVGADNSISMTASDETATVPTNNLQGYDVHTSVADIKTTLGDGTLYVMGKVGDVFGFYQYTAQYMPAHKAFLLINGGKTLTKELRMVVEDDADGIDSLSGSPEGERSVYDLSGRRVQVDSLMFNAQCSMFNRLRGIYIVNGKKILK